MLWMKSFNSATLIGLFPISSMCMVYQVLFYFCICYTFFSLKDSNILKVKGYKKILHANGNQQREGIVTLTSEENSS